MPTFAGYIKKCTCSPTQMDQIYACKHIAYEIKFMPRKSKIDIGKKKNTGVFVLFSLFLSNTILQPNVWQHAVG